MYNIQPQQESPWTEVCLESRSAKVNKNIVSLYIGMVI